MLYLATTTKFYKLSFIISPIRLSKFYLGKMSAQNHVQRLSPPIRDLVLKATQDESHFGKSEKEKAEVLEWLDKVTEGQITTRSNAKELDAQLSPRTYLVGNELTVADIALYGGLHTSFSQLQKEEYYKHPALTRYFDHIQTRPIVRKAADSMAPAFAYVAFDLDDMPPLQRASEPTKKKVANIQARPSSKYATAETESQPQDVQGKRKDKEKSKTASSADQAKKTPGTGGGKANAAEDAGEPVPSMIDLRVGHIIDVKKHPDADGLYVEQIDIGEESGPRTVVSGLVNYIPIEDMRDKYLIAVCNLKPANMRGVKSFAMVLCATHKDGKDAGIELLRPPLGSKPGDRVYFEGPEFENAQPLSQLNPKKKIFESIQPGFITLDTKEAAWINPVTKSVHKIRTKDGYCVAPNFVGASLS